MKEFTKTYYLAAGECNPEGELPITLLMNRIIEIATLHANSWGVGYRRLIAEGHAWVLSRVTIEMNIFPKIDQNYTLTTWIEDYNRHFSQRNFAITDNSGNTLGYARTIWTVIDLRQRTMVDISSLAYIRDNISSRPCPIEPQTRLRQPATGETALHRFSFTDCDANRHVNTIRYIELLLNQFTLDFHDRHRLQRLELAFVKESRYGELATITTHETEPLDFQAGITVADNERLRARMLFANRD